MEKKSIKIKDLKKSEFDEFVKKGGIHLREARLIPIIKPGDEMALASVILSSIRLIKEFRRMIFTDTKISKGGRIFVYNEVVFSQFPDSRVDGLLLTVRGDVIKDAVIFEMKNGTNELDQPQIERYHKIAKSYNIPKLITVSNQFVSEPTQCPVNIKSSKQVQLYHFSWSYLLTLAHILLFDNELNIKDKDQVEIMREVVSYLENDKSGVCGFRLMKSGWKEVVEKINSGIRLKSSDSDLHEAVISWQQEEKDLALILSRNLGVFVSSGESKYRGNLRARLDDDKKRLIDKSLLTSNLRVRGAVSDIKIAVLFEKRIVEMSATIKAPQDKKLKGQLNWMKRQLETCRKKNKEKFQKIQDDILVEIALKNTGIKERVNMDALDDIYGEIKDREIREFRVLYIKNFGKKFSSCKKFVEIIEDMLINYYSGIIQFLFNWAEPAPKIVEKGRTENTEVENKKVRK
ncbi:MAG: hypothetical protein K8S14_07355 [Actinomycetia bacterium]|nr:hypothetical protein [Actinomycetes bacterium]